MADGKDVKSGGVPWGAVIAGVIAVVALLIIVQNSQSATVKVFFGDGLTLPLWIMLAIFFILGVLFSGLVRRGIRKATGRDAKKDN